MYDYDIDYIALKGMGIIEDYETSGGRWALIPGASRLAIIPHIKNMMSKINKTVGIDGYEGKDLIDMFIAKRVTPLLSAIPPNGIFDIADNMTDNEVYIGGAGKDYLSAVVYAAREANSRSESITRLLKDAIRKGDYPELEIEIH